MERRCSLHNQVPQLPPSSQSSATTTAVVTTTGEIRHERNPGVHGSQRFNAFVPPSSILEISIPHLQPSSTTQGVEGAVLTTTAAYCLFLILPWYSAVLFTWIVQPHSGLHILSLLPFHTRYDLLANPGLLFHFRWNHIARHFVSEDTTMHSNMNSGFFNAFNITCRAHNSHS